MQYIYRTLYIVVVLLLLASCDSNDNLPAEQENVEVHFTTTLPQELQTRSYGNGKQVDVLYVQVYDTEWKELMKSEFPASGSGFHFSLKLAKNQTYKIVFWAQHKECEVYDRTDMKAIKMNPEAIPTTFDEVEKMDAFYATTTIDTKTKSSIYPIELLRPLAQINVGTTTSGSSIDKAIFTVANASTIFHPFMGKVSSEDIDRKDLTFNYTTIPNDKTLGVEGTQYNYLAMGYLFASPKGELLECELTIDDAAKNTFPEVSLQANIRTNIVGAFTNK